MDRAKDPVLGDVAAEGEEGEPGLVAAGSRGERGARRGERVWRAGELLPAVGEDGVALEGDCVADT